MLTREENETLTRTSAGTPMGDLMRRYWIPALLTWELPDPDCTPVRFMLLNEKLVAFRDTTGAVGVLAESCPHRGASLWLGRNEECGLRCVYHGWKFDVSGKCVDQMNEPENFAEKVQAIAYPTAEHGGVIWVYMGPPEHQPPQPLFEWTQAPKERLFVTKLIQETSWLQAFEGTMDTAHAPILHRALKPGNPNQGLNPESSLALGGAPRLEVDVMDYGYRYFSIRNGHDGGTVVKGYQFVMPWTQIRAGGQDAVQGHFCVPLNDESCWFWSWTYRTEGPLNEEHRTQKHQGTGPDHVDQMTFRSYRNRENNYFIDREMQRSVNFTGIVGTNIQDRAVQESMGPVYDGTKEHLGPTDQAIIVARQQLFEAARAVREGDTIRGTGDSYYTVRAAQEYVPPRTPFREILVPRMHPS